VNISNTATDSVELIATPAKEENPPGYSFKDEIGPNFKDE